MNSKMYKVCLLILLLLIMAACGKGEIVETIEVFVVETSEENEEGIYETTGYKKVNAITTTEERKNHIKTDIKAIEDYYDTEGNYIKTEVFHSNFKSSTVIDIDSEMNKKEELKTPSTILIPEDSSTDYLFNNMTDEEKEQVKEHVLSFTKKL
ncbi:hypothetical protein [Sutcliffiella cohnii]|uniref:hypothetical protein n=1 Tax=Sutcliffiella cohnii TaxID=33932 RepID=UPI002E24F275|nr:hypothetical protein [Sutcliffiella cohnii]